MKTINVALLGCGAVGRRVAETLISQRTAIAKRAGVDVRLCHILVRDSKIDRGVDPTLITTSFEEVLRANADVAIEVMGGVEPAASHVAALLQRGIHVVTANKSMLAEHGPSLRRTAALHHCALKCEASVGAAIPLMSALRHRCAESIASIYGIINGSCNFILTEMAAHGTTMDTALHEARRRGLVEPDPSADLSGRDAAEKLCVLAAVTGRLLAPAEVSCAGIERLTLDDLRWARDWGFAVRHIAQLDAHGASVGPALVPLGHWLTSVRGERNVVALQSEWGGELILQGLGAGPGPTASAVIGDVVAIAQSEWVRDSDTAMTPVRTREALHQWFARFTPGKGRGSAEAVLEALQAEHVEVTRVEWRAGQVGLLTGPVRSSQLQQVLHRLGVCLADAFTAMVWPQRSEASDRQSAEAGSAEPRSSELRQSQETVRMQAA